MNILLEATKNDSVILNRLYPIVNTSLKKNLAAYKRVMTNFVDKRSGDLFDTVPCSRIIYTDDDREQLLKSLQIDDKDIQAIIDDTYYGKLSNFNPKAAQDPITVLCLTIIRYFFMNKMKKELELACIYMSFSGKLYPSLHYRSFNYEPARYVMEFVVNNRLNNKFDIVSQGSVFGAVKSVANTWLETYDDKLKDYSDEDVVYLIQQLHNRIGSFMKNIAEVYYDSYEKKDDFIVYDSDNLSEDDYHLADSDSLRAERIIDKTMEKVNSSSVDYKICKVCADKNIKVDEVRSIIESIMIDNKNRGTVREFITLLVVTYFTQSKTKDVRDVDFITYSISPKPNTKDPHILRLKDILEQWLTENSNSYSRRKSRLATKNSYHRAILMYFTLLIHNSNK